MIMIEYGLQLTDVPVNILVNGFCDKGRVDGAMSFIEDISIEGFPPDQFTFNTLINGLCSAGQINQAIEMVDTMLQEGLDPDIYTYNSLISGLCKLGETEQTFELVVEMIARGCSPNAMTYNTLISVIKLKPLVVTEGMVATLVCNDPNSRKHTQPWTAQYIGQASRDRGRARLLK